MNDPAIIILVGGLLIGFVLGTAYGGWAESRFWRKLLIERDLAEYDGKTGEWKWKEMRDD